MKRNTFALLILIFTVFIYADMKIGGDQYGTFIKNEYDVDGDLSVESDRILTFNKGCVLQFSEYNGLKVNGRLTCKGTPEEPVVLDAKEGQQWNGVEVAKNGKIEFENVIIKNSIKGISMPDSQCILKFERVFFIKNESSIEIEEHKIVVKERKPVTIKRLNLAYNNTSTINSPQYIEGKRSPGLLALRYSSAAVAIGFVAMWVHFYESAEHYNTKYLKEQSAMSDHYRNKRDEHKTYSRMSMVGTLISIPLFVFTITIDDHASFGRKK